jgi:FADH2 O2-dependent halogenase
MRKTDFDVAIIGGGPAGSSMAAYLARAGVRCVVVENAIFPRPHVGESLVPATTRVFKELDFLDRMDELGFVHKLGATWTSASGKARPYDLGWEGLDDDCNAAIRFDERPQEGVDRNYTYHVDRGRFDLALLQHAHDGGAEVIEGVRVRGVDFDADDPELVLKLGRREVRVSARMVVDASGRKTLLGRQLGLKESDPLFDQYAIHTWYAGYDRASMHNPDHIHIHFLPRAGTWVWQIPISDEVTSIGVVTQKKVFKAAKATREAFFREALRSREDIGVRIEGAERIRPLTEEADYSYAMRQFAGDRFVLLGDAARFVDPIFSSGVSIALNSARLAHADALAALESGDFGRESFSRFERTMRRGVKNWYDFICLYYRLNVLFTYFVSHPRHRLDVLQLLQGDVYDETPPKVIEQMQRKVAEVEQNPDHMWHHLLSDVAVQAPPTT